MRRLIALASLLLVSLHGVQADCIPQDDGFGQYDINLCSMTPAEAIPPVIENLNIWVPTAVDDSVSTLFRTNFSLLIYGVNHDSFYMSTNGALFFGTATSTSGTLRIPLSNTYGNYLPLIASLWTDLYYVVGTSYAAYGTSGLVGDRTFIIRYQNFLPYVTRTTNPNIRMSFDTIFYEARPGDFEIRYYRIDQVSATYRLSLGLQSWDDGGASWTLFTDNNDWPTISSTIRGKQLSFHYAGTTVDTEHCGGLGYQFDSMRGLQLDFTDSSGVRWYFAPCGVVSNPTCRNNRETDSSTICQVSTSSVPTDLGVFGPNSIDWQYPADSSSTGVEAVLQSGSYCSSIGAQRFTTVAFVCNADATTPFISSASTPATCVYRLTVQTSLACGGGSRGNDTELLFPSSTLSTCNRLGGTVHSASLCPRPVSDRLPIALESATQILAGLSSGTSLVQLQFPFMFYGDVYTRVSIGINGALYFGTASTAVPTSPPNYGFTNTNSFPAIFAFGTSMSNLVYAGLTAPNVTHTHQTINGQRAFIVRYWNMKYTAYRGMIDLIINFDVVLTEGPPGGAGGIEIRYYTVSPNLNVQVSIGIHGNNALETYTGYVNYQYMTVQLADQLQGSSLNFTYVGRTANDACSAYGVNFTDAITTDLVYTDTTRNVVYHIAPCGQLRSTASGCPAGTSVCQVSNGASLVLSGSNPSAIEWTPVPAPLVGLRSILRDGSFCTAVNQPRTVQLDWICSKLYLVPTLVQVTEVSTCLVNIQIAAPSACLATVACSNVNSAHYSGSLCPTVEPKITQTNPVTVLSGADDAAIRVRLPIEFHFYGAIFRWVHIGSNGQLGFGPLPANYISTSLPVGFSELDKTPFIAAWLSDLQIIDDSLIAYSTETINGERVFLVRFQNVEHYGNNRPGVSDTVSFDILLFEGVSGKIELRYFTVNQPSTGSFVTVGLQNDDTDPEEALIIANSRAIDAGLAASFTNSTLRVTYSGPDITTAFCGANGYNLTSLTGRDLTFTDATATYVLRVCGVVADAECQAGVASDQAQLCRKTTSGSTTTTVSLSDWNPAENYFLYASGSTGIIQVSQNGPYCSSLSIPTVTLLDFVCSPSATTPVITNVALVGTCTYQANISTNVVCGEGDRNVPHPPPQSTLTSCHTYPGLLYDAVMCPRALNDTYAQPEEMISPTLILRSDDASINIPLGFEFYIYDRVETSVSLSSNGLATFGYNTNSQSSPRAFPTMGLSADAYPALAVFFSDLINLDTTSGIIPYKGFIAYSYAGTEPNRRIIIRFQDVDYYSTRNSVAEQSVSFDLILTEGNPGGIEVRYYVVDAAAQQTALIGMHGYGQSYTPIANLVPITRALAGELSGATVTYQWTGTSQPDLCAGVPGGYNLSSLTDRDLNFNTSSYQFWVRPCGSVTAPVCASKYNTERVTVCQATLNGATTWPLASNSPGSMAFTSPTPDVLRATTTDGLLCGTIPRQTIIDYVCNADASSAFIDYVNENSTCVYYVRIQTTATCLDNRFLGVAASDTAPRYNARLFYDPASMASKVIQTNPTALLSGSDDGMQSFIIPFPVRVYGTTYTSIQVSVNGWLSLHAGGPSGVPTQGYPLASTFTSALPVLSVFMADLYNSNSNGTGGMYWSVEGVSPNRYVMVRWNMVNYYATRPLANVGDRLLSFDVKFYENSNDIDVLYWQVTPYTVPITIGLQSTTTSYTAVNSAQSFADRGLFMERYLLRYTYVDPTLPPSSSTGGAASSSTTVPSSTAAQPSSSTPVAPSSSPAVASSSASPVMSSTAAPVMSSSAASPSSTAPSPFPSSTITPSPTTTPSSTASPIASSAVPSISSSEEVTPSISSSAADSVSSTASLDQSSTGDAAITDDASSSSSLSGGAVAGIVVGSIVGSLILCAVIFALCLGGATRKGATRLEDKDDDVSRVTNEEYQNDIEMEHVENTEVEV